MCGRHFHGKRKFFGIVNVELVSQKKKERKKKYRTLVFYAEVMMTKAFGWLEPCHPSLTVYIPKCFPRYRHLDLMPGYLLAYLALTLCAELHMPTEDCGEQKRIVTFRSMTWQPGWW